MTDDIYQDMVQPRGPAYRSSQIQPWSHYREPIETSDGRLHGESRRWGDASPQTQSRVIDTLIESSRDAGLTPRETAYVLAIARVESGFNPDAAAGTTSASGLGQFIDRTGRAYDINASNRFDVGAQSDALVRHFIDNRDLARSRGQGEEYIYKYHHDGPSRDYGGLGLSNREIVPHLDTYERFVGERLAQTQGRTQQPAAPGQGTTARQDEPANAAPAVAAAGFAGVMQTMLPPQNGVSPHITSDFGPRSVAGGSSDHRGVDFNYRGGQAGTNLQHPTVRSPVSGEVVFSGGQYGTVKIRDGEGNMHEILHLNSRSVQVTDPPTRINAGDPIGTMGGRGPNGAGQYAQHVHYQVRDASGQTVDPERFWNNRQVQAPTTPGADTRTQPAPPAGSGALRLNERGPEVIALQESLNRLGYTGRDGQPLETRSGIYGEDTKHAVQALQRAHGVGVDGVVGRDTRGALAAAIASPLMSEASHPNHKLFSEIARQLPPGTRPEVAANVTMQAMENGITSPDRLAGVMVRGSDVFVAGTMPGERAKVDLNAPTPQMQEMSDHTRQQSAQQEQARTQAPVQTSDTEQLRPRTMMA